MTHEIRQCFIARYNAYFHVAGMVQMNIMPLPRHFMETCTIPDLILHTDELIELIYIKIAEITPARRYQ